LREAFGRNRNRWWGDLDAKTARRLYKGLLFPTAISELVLELGDEIVRPEELAPLAYEARKAAKMYVRERCRVPSRVGAYLFDGFRQLYRYGKFQPNGASYEQLWIRYYEENGSSISSNNNTDEELKYLLARNDNQNADDRIDAHGDVDVDVDVEHIIDDIDDAVTEEEIVKRTCQKILEKSCTTNEAIDRFCLKKYGPNESREEENDIDAQSRSSHNVDKNDDIVRERKGCGKRWRKRKQRIDRYNDLLLEKIAKTLERDVRKLLDPPPPLLHSSIASGEERPLYRFELEECETGRKEGNWSSRRMTRQEYHSLKLFAKARKHSHQHDREANTSDATKKPTIDDDTVNDLNKGVDLVSQAEIAGLKRTQDENK